MPVMCTLHLHEACQAACTFVLTATGLCAWQGELVGGCDIIKEMAANGELLQLLVQKLGADYATARQQPSPSTSGPAHSAPQPAAKAVSSQAAGLDAATVARIEAVLASQDVMLFMKGNPGAPAHPDSGRASWWERSRGRRPEYRQTDWEAYRA